MLTIVLGVLAVLVLGPIAYSAATHESSGLSWRDASHAPTGQAPAPTREPAAVVQVYAAPTFGWRGIFAVHTWVVVKPANAAAYTRYDVVGWGGGHVVRRNYAAPDAQWYGATPILLRDLRGAQAAALIPAIEAAVASYPFAETYRSFPGPNSNTFTAWIGRNVPGLHLDLPPTAIGKDFLPLTEPLASAPSGRGFQLSLYGLGGVLAAPVEGVEINLLGLSVGLDPAPLALRLPAIGRLGSAGNPL